MASEKSVGEASLTFLIFALSAVREPTTNVRWHGRPVIVACERGMDFSVRDVVEIGVVLASEGFAEGGWNQDARGEFRIAIDLEAVAGSEGVGVDRVHASGVGELGGLFPVLEGRRKGEVAGGGERGEQRRRAVQHLSEDLGEVGEFRDVADEP